MKKPVRNAPHARTALAHVSAPKRLPRVLSSDPGGKPLAVTYKKPSDLKPTDRNPRTHSKKQIQQIAASIKEFGFVNPILLDANDRIIAGHGRNNAARLIGMGTVPTIQVGHLSPEQVRAYVIADNALAEKAGWNRNLLALELKELSVDFNFDVELTGFETPEIDLLIEELEETEDESVDEIPELDRSYPAITQLGSLWEIGRHRILCGNALKRESYERLLGAKKAQMVFIDPPYNVPVDGHARGLGKIKHRDFPMAAGEMTQEEYTAFLRSSFCNLAKFSCDGSIHMICMDWRHMGEVMQAANDIYSELKNLCVWAKTNGGMGSMYRSAHELVFVYKRGKASHINNIELGRFGRNRTNVWSYAGVNSFGRSREKDLAVHPTVKPLAMVTDAILDCSKRGSIVLDTFAGSGTTLLAAEKSGRCGYGVELDPHYVDATLIRIRDTFGIEPVLSTTSKKFTDLQRKARRPVGVSDERR